MVDMALLDTARDVCTHLNRSMPTHLHNKLFCEGNNTIPLQVQVFVAFAFILLMAFAIIGNAVVLWIIYKHKVMHHGFNFFLFNMALADLMIALFNVGSSWTFNLYYDWWYGELCTPTSFFGIAPTTVSVFSMMALSWDRCQAVVNPLRKRPLSRRRSIYTIAIIWIFSTVTALPSTIYATVNEVYSYDTHTGKLYLKHSCSNDLSENHAAIVNHMLFVIQYAVPLCCLSFTFARIACAFRRTDVATDNSSKCSSHAKAKNKAVKMLALMVFAFMFCWLPYHVYHTFELYEHVPHWQYTYLVMYWIAMSSTAYNPIIYCFANERFRVGFRFVFRWLPFVQCKQEEYEYSQLFPEKMRSMGISLQLGGKRRFNAKDQSSAGFTYQTELLQCGKENRRRTMEAL